MHARCIRTTLQCAAKHAHCSVVHTDAFPTELHTILLSTALQTQPPVLLYGSMFAKLTMFGHTR